jgi:hypothetical protein
MLRSFALRSSRAAQLAVTLATFCLWVLGVPACGGKPIVDIASDEVPSKGADCRKLGTCECRNNADCPAASPICLNARCVDRIGPQSTNPSIDTDPAGQGGAPSDGGAGGATAAACSAQPEVCNGMDDNCNGVADETFVGPDGRYSLPTNCGQCGVACAAIYAHLALGPDGKVAPSATTCNLEGNEFRCRPAQCASGYALIPDAQGRPAVCMAARQASCQACSTSADCNAGVGHACVQVGTEGTFCAAKCDSAAGATCTGIEGVQGCCPEDYSCQRSGTDLLCLPKGGSCRCTKVSVGLERGCTKTSALDGTLCLGTQTCAVLSTGGYSFGECLPTQVAEICDRRDNDCDGQADEGFTDNGQYSLFTNCGQCGIACASIYSNLALGPDGKVASDATTCRLEDNGYTCRPARCAPGYSLLHDNHGMPAVCLPTSVVNCQPCTTSADCSGGILHVCQAVGTEGMFCAQKCDPSAGSNCTGVAGTEGCCPDNYVCQASGAELLCKPKGESCRCNQDSVGIERACSATSTADSNVCLGTQICAKQVDGSFAYGQCQLVPATETCDGRDNDCDGTIDEGFTLDGKYSLNTNCGQCGVACADIYSNLALGTDGKPASDSTTCDLETSGYRCHPARCAPGFSLLYDSQAKPAVCVPTTVANCQACASNNDCSGGVGHVCVAMAGEGHFCAARCDQTAGVGCNGVIGEQGCCPSNYLCQQVGSDRVCQPKGGSCRCTAESAGMTRVCTRTSSADSTVCVGADTCSEVSPGTYGWGGCVLTAVTETCDGRDNDCNGTVDEGYTVGGSYHLDTNCGACGNSCVARFSVATHHATGACNPAHAGAPDCEIASCTSTEVGGAKLCATNADCSGDPISPTCDATLKACAKACAQPSDCAAGTACQNGYCTTNCVASADCEATFGVGATCSAGHCSRHFDWKDLDAYVNNGCECAALASDEPLTFESYPTTTPPSVDRNCDGIEGNAARALFVVPGGSGDGSRKGPLGSIQAAVNLFDPSKHEHILVATGLYTESVLLKAGVRIYGGYSLDFKHRDIVQNRTTILAPEPDFSSLPELPGTLNAKDITIRTVVAGLTIEGYDVSNSPKSLGQPSYAIYVVNSNDQLQFINDQVIGGQGGPGALGASGLPGNPGGSGGAGVAARECLAPDCRTNSEIDPGGLGGANPACAAAAGCPGMPATGADIQTFPAPAAGCTYPVGGGWNEYTGSDAKYCKYDCTIHNNALNGLTGANASATSTPGVGGLGCSNGDGSIVGGKWVAAVAVDGTNGTDGKGAMGGSAGGTVRNSKSATCTVPALGANYGDLGGSAGGGGAGGCGGARGLGGGSGGASIAVFIASANGTYPRFTGMMIMVGSGGLGGNGGAGGAGGPGGNGGPGGAHTSVAWCAGFGGGGGDGSAGGDAGGGGGGCGGPRYGFAGVGIPDYGTAAHHNVFVAIGAAGSPGKGGAAPFAGVSGPGKDGVSGGGINVKVFP